MREYTNKLIDLLDSGCIDAEELAKGLLRYMSESEVADFATCEGYIDDDTDDTDDTDDDTDDTDDDTDDTDDDTDDTDDDTDDTAGAGGVS